MATTKKTASTVKPLAGKLVPALPESSRSKAKGRKRLAKAFPRPLEKKHKGQQPVREKFSIPGLEYDQLLELKQRLAGLGVAVKKNELVRAGLVLLAGQDDDELKTALSKVLGVG